MEDSLERIDDAIENFIYEATDKFTMNEVVEYLQKTFKSDDKGLVKEVGSILKYSDMVFINDDESFTPKALFFNKGKFIITPTKYEIQRGVLFSGHRFSIFSSEDIFPTDIKLTSCDDNVDAGVKNICTTIENAAYYYSLLGSEEMIHYFIAESQINAGIISDGDPKKEITLTVFDFSDFYVKYGFEVGDSLVIEIVDWDTGEFKYDFVPKEDIANFEQQKEWIQSLEAGMKKVIKAHGFYIDIPEQISLGFYNAPTKILDTPLIGIEDFIEKSEDIEIIFVGERTVLAEQESLLDSDDDNATAPPSDLSISSGEIESIDSIIKELKLPMSSIEIEGFMREEIFNGRNEFSGFFDNCFAIAKPNFVDDAQNAIFMNYLEEMWEELLDTYNPIVDEEKQRARVAILNAFDEKVQWLHDLNNSEISLDKIPKDMLKKLTAISEKLTQFLKLLNTDDRFSSDEDAEEIIDAVEAMADNQGYLISEINEVTLGA